MSVKAVEARWASHKEVDGILEDSPDEHLPEAKYRGFLTVMNLEIPAYVLSNDQRVIGRTSATEMLTGIKGAVRSGNIWMWRRSNPSSTWP